MLRVEGLTKSIQEGEKTRFLFKDVSISFSDHGLYVLEGRSGSGKSTFLHILALMEKAERGKIFLDGEELLKRNEKGKSDYRRHSLGFIFQNHHLEDTLTASENIALPLLIQGEKEKIALKKAKDSLLKFFSKKVDGKKAVLLSGGEKARVSFLRATIANPPILLCDEPTGALDTKNAHFMMGEIKKYSKTHLVILVSHDRKLAKKYADYLLLLEDGKLLFSKEKEEEKMLYKQMIRKKRGKIGSLLWFLFRKSIPKDAKKSVLTIGTTFFLFSFLLLFIGFFEGGRSFLEDGEDRSLLYLSASMSASKKEELPGSRLSLARSYRPKESEAKEILSSFENVRIENDYSYFFPSSLPYRENGYLKENVSLCPIWDLSLKNRNRSFLTEGEVPNGESMNYVLINEELASSLQNPIGSLLEVSYESSFECHGEEEDILLSFRFEVTGVVKDFAFLSLPRIFYSYRALEKSLESQTLKNGKTLPALFKEASGEEEWTSYSYLLFYEEKEAKRLKEFASACKEPFLITNTLWTSLEGFDALWQAMEGSLTPFLAMEAVFSFFSIALIAYSSFLEERRFLSLLDALGMLKEERVRYFENGVGSQILIGALLAFLISFPLSRLFSSLLEGKFGIPSLLVIPYSHFLGIPLLLPFLLLAFAAFLLFFGVRLPIYFLSKKSLAGELKDE